MVLDTYLYKALSWSFMALIRSELYCFGIRIQNIVFHCHYRSKTNYIWLTSLNIKKNYRSETFTIRYLYRSYHLYVAVVSLIVVAMFINYSNMYQYHYRSHTCYNSGKNLLSNKILVTYTLVLTNTKWPYHNI